MNITCKRAYDTAGENDGCRILVDRLWPRGLSKNALHIDLWLPEIAPSVSLRKWFNHEPAKWPEFSARYLEELGGNEQAVRRFNDAVRECETVTFVYGAKDKEHNHAVVLLDFLRRRFR